MSGTSQEIYDHDIIPRSDYIGLTRDGDLWKPLIKVNGEWHTFGAYYNPWTALIARKRMKFYLQGLGYNLHTEALWENAYKYSRVMQEELEP